MEDQYLYHKIAESIRQEILEGRLRSGDPLPSVRSLCGTWSCTSGTIQHAYRELANQGLVISRPGKGTRVSVSEEELRSRRPLRIATLVNKAEAFLLEELTAGYGLPDIQRALEIAADRWRSYKDQPDPSSGAALRLGGSHDLVLGWVVSHIAEILPGNTFELHFTGSLGGLIALAEGKADLAGCHLWDVDTDTYNIPYVRRLLPGRRAGLIRLAIRRIGLILPPNNPAGLHQLKDLARPGIVFANRQTGSGTRVWLDAQLALLGISAARIEGFGTEYSTHTDVARMIAEGKATVGVGLEASARSFGLDFVGLTDELFDLVGLEEGINLPATQNLIRWLLSSEGKTAMSQFAGYDCSQAGRIQWV